MFGLWGGALTNTPLTRPHSFASPARTHARHEHETKPKPISLKLATLPQLLDVIEQLIGPNILLYNTTYIIQEAHTESHVRWHQDLTYWGLDSDAQVSVWLALSE